MEDRSLEVLENYDIDIIGSRKGRGAIICETKAGYVLVREYNGTNGRMEYEEELLNKVNDKGIIHTDSPIRNKNGELVTVSEDGTKYIVKRWYIGKECDVKYPSDIYRGAEGLGELHKIFNEIKIDTELPMRKESIYEEYMKHNTELKRARNFIRNKTKKGQFELDILKNFDKYYSIAGEAVERLKTVDGMALDNNYGITHGNYNYHNIVFDGDNVCVLNFEGSRYELQILDFYNYLRKVMEKYQWDEKIGLKLLEIYDKKRGINDFERELLKALITYPEKYWKVINRYLNSSKAFMPDRNYEKMEKVYTMEIPKSSFVLKI